MRSPVRLRVDLPPLNASLRGAGHGAQGTGRGRLRCLPMRTLPRLSVPGLAALLTVAALVPACAERAVEADPSAPAAAAEAGARLLRSTPADGARLSQSPDALVLSYSRRVRLIEVIVQGSDGSEMPMMVTSAGEAETYSLPLSGLGAGSWTVRWRATSGGEPLSGTIKFTIG
jgi:methionine-rich copper-binding protein CopC